MKQEAVAKRMKTGTEVSEGLVSETRDYFLLNPTQSLRRA